MSLISEALKKARQEAARQDSLRQGVPYAVGAVDPPQRRNPLLPLLAGLGAGCLLAGLLFGIAWITGLGPFAKPPQETQVAQAPAPPPVEPTVTPQVAPAEPTPVVTEVAPPVSTPPPVTPTPVPEQSPQPVETRPVPPVEQPVVRPEPQAAVPPAPAPEERPVPEPSPAPPPIQIQPTRPAAPAPPANPGELEEGKVYKGEVPIPGGGSLKLNGIAFSQEQPIVVLDGRVMGPGEVIQGFTVVEIQSDRVKLQGHGATVFVTTK